jgi:hypothetical protein
MNNFGKIILIQKFNKVTYYSVSVNDDVSLFQKFIEKHTIENKDKLYHIMAWIEKIGNKIGAYQLYFRNEAETSDASALPPHGIDRVPAYVEVIENNKRVNVPNNLRLYCLRANNSVVFLFSGDVKTAANPQDCSKVKSHFKMANRLTKLINEAFIKKDIVWNSDFSDIIFNGGFELEFN